MNRVHLEFLIVKELITGASRRNLNYQEKTAASLEKSDSNQ